MAYEVIKSRAYDNTERDFLFEKDFLDYEIQEEYRPNKINSEKYFNLNIEKKDYPSCYHQNVLVLAAKKLLERDEGVYLSREFSRELTSV